MKLIFVGCGGAFAPPGKGMDGEYGVWHSNILVQQDGKYLAIDMGGDFRHSVKQIPGTSLPLIEAAYLSHTHGDHLYGLEWYFLMKYFTEVRQGKDRPILYGATDVIERAWKQGLSASLETIENMRESNLTTFAEVRPFDPKNPEPFIWRGISFTPIQTVHVMSGTKIQPSWGLMIQQHYGVGKRIFLTTDTQFAPRQLPVFYNSADVILHDCETLPLEWRSNVHAHYNDLKTLPVETKAKMWLYHNQPDPPHEDAKASGFAGFVARGQVFDFTENKT